MYLFHNDPLALKLSLRVWLTEMMHQARGRSLISTRRLGHMLNSRRAIRMREFNMLMSVEDFATAICNLTGAQVGSVRAKHQRSLGSPNPQPGEGGEHGPYSAYDAGAPQKGNLS